MPYRSRDTSRFRPKPAVATDRYRLKRGNNNGGKWLLALLGLTLVAFLSVLIVRHWPFHPKPPIQTETAEEPAHSYDSVDAAALAFQPQANESAEAFARRLAGSAHTEQEKARAIYRWIAENIAYDDAMTGHATPDDEAVPTVMAKRRTICTGYAQLYRAMAKAVGLDCEVVRGWAKGLRSSSSTTGADHAWNAVKIGSNWRLVDVTWGAGHGGSSGWEKEFQGSFFFPDPSVFVQSHLPTHPMWQFVNPPWSKERFDALPHMWSSFFEMGMALGSHFDKTIHVSNGQLKLWLKVPPDIFLGERFFVGETKLTLRPQLEGKVPGTSKYEFAFDFAGQRPDRLIIFASRSLNGSYESVLEYAIQNSP